MEFGGDGVNGIQNQIRLQVKEKITVFRQIEFFFHDKVRLGVQRA